MKKVLLLSILIFCLFSFPAFATTYEDVPEDHWAKEYIDKLSGNPIIPEGPYYFHPDEPITRSEFAKVTIVLFSISSENNRDVFNDCSSSAWYARYVTSAYDAGIIKGDGNGKFYPDAKITRQEMVVIAMRAFIYASSINISNDINGFNLNLADKTDIDEWAEPSISFAYKNNIIKGFEGNIFAPKNIATRAQAVVTLGRAYEKMQELKG